MDRELGFSPYGININLGSLRTGSLGKYLDLTDREKVTKNGKIHTEDLYDLYSWTNILLE
jgi:hypothetical protein